MKRWLRIIISGLLLVLFLFSFVHKNSFTDIFLNKFASIQFISGFVNLLENHKLTVSLIIILVLVILFGRFYCSFICPLGTLQDIPLIFHRKKKFKYNKTNLIIRYLIPVLSIFLFIFSVTILLELTEPYSISARVGNILFGHLDNRPGILSITEITSILTLIIFIIILILSFFKGRFFCNSICPIGAILSIITRFSIFKIKINNTKCISCGKCEQICKAECINAKEKAIDSSKCVLCLNCLDVCKFNAIKYKVAQASCLKAKNKKGNDKNILKGLNINSQGLQSYPGEKIEQSSNPEGVEQNRLNKVNSSVSRRQFMTLGCAGILTYPISKIVPGKIKKAAPATPPGSISLKHFTNSCIACQLCVTKCPTGVLQPSFLEYGVSGMMQPFMNYNKNSCDYNCVICTQTCPTGAIKSLTVEKKQKVSLGNSHIDKNICVVYKNNTSCAACQEICPTGAIYMINYKNGLPAPKINNDICIGCGACEHSCPTIPTKAIKVTPFAVHKEIKELSKNKDNTTTNQDKTFAF